MDQQLFEDARNELVTIDDFLRFSMSAFANGQVYFGHGAENARDEAQMLILGLLNLPQGCEAALRAARLTSTERDRLVEALIARIEGRVPTAYLTNKAYFAGLEFYVDQRVLIPRSPLAEIIEQQFVPLVEPDDVRRILEIGTGSGCIAIACALAFPNAEVDAVDISSDALAVAQRNVETFLLDEQMTLRQSDVFSGVPDVRYDIIVSNPPYVDALDQSLLPNEYLHEPMLGLAGGDDGLDIVKRILAEAKNFLADEGILVVEVGNSMEAMIEQFPDVPFLWLEFERGGHGVFVLTAQQVSEFF